MSHSGFTRRSTLSLVLATARTRGWLYALNIGATLLRGRLRDIFQANYGRARALVLVFVVVAGAWLLYWLGTAPLSLDNADGVATTAVLLLVALLLVFLGLSHTLVPGRMRGQVVLALIRAAVFSLVVVGIGWIAFDGWWAFWQRSPAGAALFGLLTVAILVSFRDALNVLIQMTLVRYQVIDISMAPNLTDEGRRRIAYHEAGHALCYALAEGIPVDATASLNTEVYGFLAGAVDTPMPNDPTEVTRDYMDIRLRMLVAGKVAEEIVYDGDACMGAIMDMEVFQPQAALYLQGGFGEGYLHEPKDEADRNINLAAIEHLRHSLEQQIREFLLLNRDLLDQAAAQLLKVEFLGCEELAVLLPGAHLPAGWRKRRWPPSVPLYTP